MTETPVARRIAGAFDPVDELMHLERLPLDRAGSYVRYEGSIDKKGLNGDENWSGCPKGTNEWIVFEHRGPGCIHNLTKHAFLGRDGECTFRFYFDGSEQPALSLPTADFGNRYPALEPFGALFANELGYSQVRTLLSGMGADGSYYDYHPMPYARGARMEIENRGARTVRFDRIAVTKTHEYDALYASTPYGVFRGVYLPPTDATELRDTVFAEVRGCGHVVGSARGASSCAA